MELNLENATKYHYGKFPPQNLDLSRIMGPAFDAIAALSRYDQMIKSLHQSKINSELFISQLRKQDAIISSRMEGTVSTMDEILEYAAAHKDDFVNDPKFRSDVYETVLHDKALVLGQKYLEEGRPLSQSLLKEIHQLLLSQGRGAKKNPGQFKTKQNYVADRGVIVFVPINEDVLQEGLDNLFDYIANSSDHPIIKTCITHVEFEALHPFKDGNGRIGRILIPLMLWDSGILSKPHFYISGYFEEHRDLYNQTMRNVSQNDAWDDWCIFFLEAVKHQANKNLSDLEKINDLYEKMDKIFHKVLRSADYKKALDFVFAYPVFKSSEFTKHSGIPSATAARFAKTLLNNNLIIEKEKASGRRSAEYKFESLIEMIRV